MEAVKFFKRNPVGKNFQSPNFNFGWVKFEGGEEVCLLSEVQQRVLHQYSQGFTHSFYFNLGFTDRQDESQFKTPENSLIEIGGFVNSKLKLKTNCEVSETIKNGIKKSNFLRGKMFPK